MTLNAYPLNSQTTNAPSGGRRWGVNESLDLWQKTVRTAQGPVQTGVTVTVYNAVNRADGADPANTVATVYADLTETAQDNPFVTGADGVASFYAPAGFYHVHLQKGAEEVWLLNQPLGNLKAQSRDAVDIPSGTLAGVQFSNASELVARLLESYNFSVLGDYLDDSAAASAGVPVGGLYRTGSTLKTRVQ